MQNPTLKTVNRMRVIVTAATTGEWMPGFMSMDKLYTADSKRMKVRFHQSGIGILSTAVSLTKLIIEERPDLIIQVGLAGTYNNRLSLGKVVVVEDEVLGDLGVEEDGKWVDIFDMKLEKSSAGAFDKKTLPNPWLDDFNLLQLSAVQGITVNEITTSKERIQQLNKKYAPCTESMEGAALHYVCRDTNTPFLQMRAISNYVGERDKSKWKIDESITALNDNLLKYLDKLYKSK